MKTKPRSSLSLFPLAVLTVAVIAGTSIQTAAGAVSQTTALSAGGRLITSARPVVATAPTISTRAIRFPIATRAVRYVPAHPVTVLPSRQRPPRPPASRPSTEKASAPVIVTISVPNSPLPATGGSANVTVTTRGATDCQLTLVNHPRLAMHFDQQRFVLDGAVSSRDHVWGQSLSCPRSCGLRVRSSDRTLGRPTQSRHRRRSASAHAHSVPDAQ